MEKKLILFSTTILLLTIILTGCLNSENKASKGKNTAQDTPTSENDSIIIPHFRLKDMYGNDVSNDIFTDYKLTLVNIWAVGCPNCIEELPYLQQIHSKMKERGVNVVGIVAGGENNEALDILNKQGITYTNIMPDDKLFDEFIVKIAPAVPISLLVDSNGCSLTKPIVGTKTKKEFLKLIKNGIKLVEVNK
jgi:thiol-disulfide isomerase/thioredoxin